MMLYSLLSVARNELWCFWYFGCMSLCILCFSHSLHVYLIHIKRACIKANNLNRVSTHCNVSLEMTASACRAACGGVISFIFLIYSFVCLSLSLQLHVDIVFHLFTSQLLLTPLPVLVRLGMKCLLSASEQAGFRPYSMSWIFYDIVA